MVALNSHETVATGSTQHFERHLKSPLQESLLDSPAVLVNGPRQCGKTTLVQQYRGDMEYFSLDDPSLLEAVRADPLGFVKRLDRAIIDEVQRAPQLLMALKLVIDQDRRPGRVLLTGSANHMALPQISDSLAGRIEIHTLLPLSNSELNRQPSSFLKKAKSQEWTPSSPQIGAPSLELQVLSGGYPEMLHRTTLARKQAWARAYIHALVERDIQDIAQLDQVKQVPQLLSICAEMTGQLLNLTHIGGQIGLDAKTVDKYIGILEKLFLVRRLPAWSRNELSRLIKTPKLHFLDAGLQSTLTRLSPDLLLTQRARFGATLETWVFGELQKMLTLSDQAWFLSHYRDKDQVEVDFVLESGQREIIGIEVKAAASVQSSDFKGLKRLRDIAGQQFLTGIVLFDGEQPLSFGDGMWAIPMRHL
jgi:predicted AAA+ superfamily ATPase